MTHGKTLARRGPGIAAAALAALLLAGCSTGHIGDDWQCPLAEGGLCDSVAAADPAVPDPDAAKGTVLAEPLWRMRAAADGRGGQAAPMSARSCVAACGAGFDPFAWLTRLFGVEGNGESGARVEAPSAGGPGLPAHAAAKSPATTPPEEPHSGDAATDARAADAERLPPVLPDVPNPADLRTGEAVARIWIAPFVDADGVYREASHVRVVLEPAGWRLP